MRANRQHGAAVRPRLSKLPSEYLFEQVYASFQHDRSAVLACQAMGWQNVMWGSDYPHYEGTYGHTQKTLHELFDDVDPDISQRVPHRSLQRAVPPRSGTTGAITGPAVRAGRSDQLPKVASKWARSSAVAGPL